MSAEWPSSLARKGESYLQCEQLEGRIRVVVLAKLMLEVNTSMHKYLQDKLQDINALLVLDMEMLVHTQGVCLLGSCHICIKPVTSEQTLNVHFAASTYCTFYIKSFETKNELT